MNLRAAINERRTLGWRFVFYAVACLIGAFVMFFAGDGHWVTYVFVSGFLVLGAFAVRFAFDCFRSARNFDARLASIFEE